MIRPERARAGVARGRAAIQQGSIHAGGEQVRGGVTWCGSRWIQALPARRAAELT